MYMQGFHAFKTLHILKLFACCQGNRRQLQRKGILGVALTDASIAHPAAEQQLP